MFGFESQKPYLSCILNKTDYNIVKETIREKCKNIYILKNPLYYELFTLALF